jgi:hypothetical protein
LTLLRGVIAAWSMNRYRARWAEVTLIAAKA